MPATLTERYIAATVKSLPPAAQADVQTELQASIADAVEARVDQGEERVDAERAVLTELGDPAVLAAGYADRPLQLIGPRYFLLWWRLLKLLLIIVPVCAAGGVALAQALADASIGEIIGQAIAVGLSAVVYVSFWVTLVFAVLERTTRASTLPEWNVDLLPEPHERGSGRSELIGSLVFLGLAAGAILWDHFRGFAVLRGEVMSVLDPALWPWAITALMVIIAAEAVLAIAVYARGRWTPALAVAKSAIAVLFISLTISLLARGELINPVFLDAVFLDNGVGPDVVRILAVILGFGIVGVTAWGVIDSWRRAVRRPTAELG